MGSKIHFVELSLVSTVGTLHCHMPTHLGMKNTLNVPIYGVSEHFKAHFCFADPNTLSSEVHSIM